MTDLGAQTSPEGNPEWLLPPHRVSFTGSSASSSLTAASAAPYEVSNAAFDEAGNLLFYAKDRWIYDASHVDIDPYTNGFADTEVAIVSRPGTCDQYYVISLTPFGATTMALNYVTVTVTGSSVAVSSPIIVPSSINALNQGGIAVSPPNVEMERYLYTAGRDQVDRFRISNAGISFDVNIVDAADFTNYGYGNAQATQEAELAGNCIAWGSSKGLGAPNAYVAIFKMATGTLDDFLSLPLPDEHLRIAGMEFANRGSRLYVSTFSEEEPIDEEGIYYYDLQDDPEKAVKVEVDAEVEEQYSKTHLELARDGRMYLVSQSGLLSHFEVDVNLIQVSSLGLSVNSNQADDIYTLPDQFDYDEYYSSTGYPAALITDLDVNGLSVEPSLPTLPEFFTCNSLTMNTATAGVNEYRITLTQTSGSSTGVKYNSGWKSGSPVSPQNMKAFPVPALGGSGNRLYLNNSANTGAYDLEVEVRNFCQVVNGLDGEFGYESPTNLAISDISINSEALAPDVPPTGPTPPDFFDCVPLQLDVTATGAEYRIWVYQVNPATGAQVVTTGAMDYTPSAWLPGPPAQVDLLTLTDQAGVSLTNNPNSYAVEVWVRDECNSPAVLSRKGQFKMNSDPNANTVTMRLGPAAPPFPPSGGLQMPSQNIASPVLQGTSGEVDVSNSAGLITYYRVNIDEVDCSTGAITGSILQGSNVQLTTPNNTSELENIGYNAVTYDGTYGYFNNPANNVIGKCYRVEVWVGNVCGEASDWSYIQFNGNYRLADPQQAPPTASLAAKVWPNPTTSHALIEYQLPQEGAVHLQIFDAQGRPVSNPLPSGYQAAGQYRQKLDLAALPAGVYQWRLLAGNEMQQGRLVKQ